MNGVITAAGEIKTAAGQQTKMTYAFRLRFNCVT
jgi:hypothetical protein